MYNDLIKIILLLSIFFLLSNVLLAPLLRIINLFFGARPLLRRTQMLSVSVIVPAYNEAENILTKIETLERALLPLEVEWEVIIGSDGSSDRTVEIALDRLKEMDSAKWRVLDFVNEGKCSTLNKLVEAARGEIIISTDADIPVPENSMGLVVNAFRDNDRLGCLSCVPWFAGLDIGSQKSYWSLEDQIRRAESQLGKLIVVTGMVYAYRKELFADIPTGVMADDLWIPLNVLLKGYDCVQVNDLLVPYEKTDEKYEVQRRKRVIVGGMDVVRRLWPKLIYSPALFLIVFFHKMNRWALPIWIILFLLSSVGLWPLLAFAYIVGAVGIFLFLGRDKLLTVSYGVFSPVLSFVEVMKKRDVGRWERAKVDD